METVVDINGTGRKINNKMRAFARVTNFPFLKGTEDFDFDFFVFSIDFREVRKT